MPVFVFLVRRGVYLFEVLSLKNAHMKIRDEIKNMLGVQDTSADRSG